MRDMIGPVRPILLAVILWMAVSASAEDAQLKALHATLVTLRAHAESPSGGDPATWTELSVAKHQLRDWIETQLGTLPHPGDEHAFADGLNGALRGVSVRSDKDDPDPAGSLGDVRVSNENGLLTVTTAIGISCQRDESAYVYRRIDGRWRRVLESEQSNANPKQYAPQHNLVVHVWQGFKDNHEVGPAFVMTLGHEWGCASAWHRVYYRIWRVDASGAKPLIDGSAEAYLRAGSFIVGSIGQDRFDQKAPIDALIEFSQRSVDTAIHNREAIRHFLIDGDQIRRIDPIALSPRDFVDEWLTSGWNESATWSASPCLSKWHRKLHADWVGGEFSRATMHCQTPDLWQIAFAPSNAQKNYATEPEAYFLVRWRPPYHFTLVDVSEKPWPRCVTEDLEADEWRTLFNTQDWRW